MKKATEATMDNTQQLLLGFSVSGDADFDSFYKAAPLRIVLSSLKQFVLDDVTDFLYLSGSTGSGKSHLLQAVCNYADQIDKQAIYLPLSQLCDYPPEEIFAGMQECQFLCLDELDAIVGNHKWEVAIFDLFNQRQALEKPIYFAAHEPASQLAVQLADLQSRLCSCLSFQLPQLSDEEKAALLQFRAELRGMALNESCSNYIIQRSGRNNKDLMKVLDKLDHESLKAGRKVSVPFIKEMFSW